MRADASEGARHNRQTIDVGPVVGDCPGNPWSNSEVIGEFREVRQCRDKIAEVRMCMTDQSMAITDAAEILPWS